MQRNRIVYLFAFVFLPAILAAQDDTVKTIVLNDGTVLSGNLLDAYAPVYAVLRTGNGRLRLVDYSELSPGALPKLEAMQPLRYSPDNLPEISGVGYEDIRCRSLDRVYMKNGKCVAGHIIERRPEKYLVLLWPSGEEWYCYNEDIDSVGSQLLEEEMTFRRFRSYSSAAAAWMSIAIPGLGHVHNGEYLKSALFASASALFAYATVSYLMKSIAIFGPRTAEERRYGNYAAFSFICFVGVRAWDIIDAGSDATEKEIARRQWQRQRCSMRQRRIVQSMEFGLAPLPGGAAAGVQLRF